MDKAKKILFWALVRKEKKKIQYSTTCVEHLSFFFSPLQIDTAWGRLRLRTRVYSQQAVVALLGIFRFMCTKRLSCRWTKRGYVYVAWNCTKDEKEPTRRCVYLSVAQRFSVCGTRHDFETCNYKWCVQLLEDTWIFERDGARAKTTCPAFHPFELHLLEIRTSFRTQSGH